mmetsp:Transcript_11896/g.28170  ORF Transcript_11896/g.28170 Transcript_11896/m.28170 type:complete len:113 (+) Transcript_11896:48-386(+)
MSTRPYKNLVPKEEMDKARMQQTNGSPFKRFRPPGYAKCWHSVIDGNGERCAPAQLSAKCSDQVEHPAQLQAHFRIEVACMALREASNNACAKVKANEFATFLEADSVPIAS